MRRQRIFEQFPPGLNSAKYAWMLVRQGEIACNQLEDGPLVCSGEIKRLGVMKQRRDCQLKRGDVLTHRWNQSPLLLAVIQVRISVLLLLERAPVIILIKLKSKVAEITSTDQFSKYGPIPCDSKPADRFDNRTKTRTPEPDCVLQFRPCFHLLPPHLFLLIPPPGANLELESMRYEHSRQ